MSKNTKPSRTFILCGDINHDNVKPIIEDINLTNYEDGENKDRTFERKENPIKLIITSSGGYVDEGLALFDVIEKSETPVHTIVSGKAFSMGFILSLAGVKRFCYQRARFMCHEISYGWFGFFKDHQERMDDTKILQKTLNQIILDKTLITEDQIKDVYDKKRDWYISAQDALKLKIVDGIL